jgi:hypothetical protein
MDAIFITGERARPKKLPILTSNKINNCSIVLFYVFIAIL